MTWYASKPRRIQAARITSIDDTQVTFDVGEDEDDWIKLAMAKQVGDVGGIWVLNSGLRVGTLEGTMRADEGDYLVRGTKGELYTIKGDIFPDLYQPLGT